MPPPFIPLTRFEFVDAARSFGWSPAKSSIHVHHTWRPTQAQYAGRRTIEGMWRHHTVTNGWSDIAQHVSIAPDGLIWTGRNWNASPASAIGFNGRHAFMIETIGDFDRGRETLEGEQLDSLLCTVATLQILFALDGDASIRFHNEMSRKTCPGSSVDRAAFVAAVAARRAEMADGFGPGRLRTPPLAPGAGAALDAFAALPEGLDGEDAEHVHDEALAAAFPEGPAVAPLAATPPPPAAGAAQEALALADGRDEAALLEELGRRLQAGETQAALPDTSSPDTSNPEAPLSEAAFLTRETLAAVGGRAFQMLGGLVFRVACGDDPADRDLRDRLRAAFGLGREAVAQAIAALLVGALGVTAGVATVVAALLIRGLLVPLHADACALWRGRFAA